MRVAIVHDWLTGMRGGEKVLSLLCRLLPQADLLTLIRVPGVCDRHIERMRIRTSFLNELPGVGIYYRYLLPIMPLAIEQMDVSQYDLIVSCSHCVAKGIQRRAGSAHLCYCFTPMRYVWDAAEAYQGRMGLSGLALRAMTSYLRAWDLRSSKHVDTYLANSSTVAKRIRRHYGRDAQVVYSPIDVDYYTPDYAPREDFYLMVSALVPYKRVDQAVAACAKLGRPLRIIGNGPEMPRLRQSLPPNVQLMGWQSDATILEQYRRCRALLMPGEEDFGLVPLEAMACGAPVIAYKAGGALETVLDIDKTLTLPSPGVPGEGSDGAGATGLLYPSPTVEGLIDAIRRFEALSHRFVPQQLVSWARQFSADRFIREFKQALRPLLVEKGLREPWLNATTS